MKGDKKNSKSKKKTEVKEEVKNKVDTKSQNKVVQFLNEYWQFYKENLRKKHIILYIIGLVIFFAFIVNLLNSYDPANEVARDISSSETSVNMLKIIFKEKLPLTLVIVFAGFTPFVYVPTLGFITAYIFANKLVEAFAMGNNVVIVALGIIIQLFGFGMAIAAGYYYCSLSSKRFRYNQSKGYSMDDVKKNFYSATKKNEKLGKLNKKMEEKAKQKEKLNVKVPYRMLLESALFAFIIVLIGTLITQGV